MYNLFAVLALHVHSLCGELRVDLVDMAVFPLRCIGSRCLAHYVFTYACYDFRRMVHTRGFHGTALHKYMVSGSKPPPPKWDVSRGSTATGPPGWEAGGTTTLRRTASTYQRCLRWGLCIP